MFYVSFESVFGDNVQGCLLCRASVKRASLIVVVHRGPPLRDTLLRCTRILQVMNHFSPKLILKCFVIEFQLEKEFTRN